MWQKIWKKGGWSRFVEEGAFFFGFSEFYSFFVIFGCVVYVVYASSFFVVCP